MRHPLPYAFARTSQLLLEDDGQQLVLWHGPSPNAGALSEVLRKHVVQQFMQLDAAPLASPWPDRGADAVVPSSWGFWLVFHPEVPTGVRGQGRRAGTGGHQAVALCLIIDAW